MKTGLLAISFILSFCLSAQQVKSQQPMEKSLDESITLSFSLQQITLSSVDGTSCELDDYGLVINSSGEWVGRNILADGSVSGKNGTSFLIPKGSVICWSGNMQQVDGVWHPLIESHPDLGWVMCDGTNGTPNLVDQFVMGTDNPTQIGHTGGTHQITLESEHMHNHNHNLPSTSTHQWTHGHTYHGDVYRSAEDVWLSIIGGNVGWGHWKANHTVANETDSRGSHTHSITGQTTYTGSGQAVDIRPPYYAVIYLQSVDLVESAKTNRQINQEVSHADDESHVIPITLNRELIDSLGLVYGQDAWLNLDYETSPGGPILHHETAEHVWWIEEMAFLLLGATGAPLPQSIFDRSSVHITCRLEDSTGNPSTFWLFPESNAVTTQPNTNTLEQMRSLGVVNASFLSQVANFYSGYSPHLSIQGTDFFNSAEEKLINASGDWVGGNVRSSGEISGNNGLDLTVPKGAIVLWNGNLNVDGHPVVDGNPIQEWHVCDGSSPGVPDLRDRFVICQGTGYTIGESGGSNTAVLTSNSLPSHSHSLDGVTVNTGGSHLHAPNDTRISSSGIGLEILGPNQSIDSDLGHAETSSQIDDYTGSHSHTGGVTEGIGSATPIDIRPKYYTLAFLICTGG